VRVSRIEIHPRHADRVFLHTADGRVLDLARLAVEEAGLRPGVVIDESQLARLRDRDSFERTLGRALHFLEARPRSEQEVRARLAREQVSPELVDRVIDRLRALGLIDDAAFARFWIENRTRFSPRGARALKAELRRKGLSEEIIADVDEVVDEEENIHEVARRLARRLAKLDRQAFRQRLWGQLARRGFDFDLIGPAVDSAWQSLLDERSGNA